MSTETNKQSSEGKINNSLEQGVSLQIDKNFSNNLTRQNNNQIMPSTYQFKPPTKNPQDVFCLIDKSLLIVSQQQNRDDDNRSQTSQKSNASIQQKRKGSFLERLQQRHQSEQQKLNQKKKADMKSVFLQNVDYKATKQELQLIFQDCAKIQRVTILKNTFTNHPKGCAYISFQTEQGVERALNLSGVTLRNRVIKVKRKRTNLPGIINDKKDDNGLNILGMIQNYAKGTFRGRGRGRGRGH